MRAEPRDFQCASPTGLAEQTAHSEAGVDQPQIHVFAGDHINAANSLMSEWDGRSTPNFAHVGDPGRITIRSIARFRVVLSEFRVLVTVRSSSIGVALVIAFGLGWACASIFNSNPGASLAPLNQKADGSLGRLDSEKQDVRRSHGIASAAAAPNPAPTESSKPKLFASAASARLSSSGVAQMHTEPQSMVLHSMQERTSPLGALTVSVDLSLPLRPSPVPDTKPTTIAGWTVREVYGEKAVLVGPDHVWTVRTGDTVPGVGQIDTIVRWGNRWIVATTAGLISTE
jgi:hypothetical protein